MCWIKLIPMGIWYIDYLKGRDLSMKRARKGKTSAKHQPVEKSSESELNYIRTSRNKKSKKKRIDKKFVAIFIISLIVIIVTSVAVMFMSGAIELFTSDKVADEYVVPVDKVTGKVNVLIMGVDKDGLRTDTIVVASLDTDDKTLNFLSIPRDTRMYIGSKYQKINSAHALTQGNGKIIGPKGTIEAVTRLTAIPINYYVEFSFDTFKETVDAIGGVNFDVPQNMYYKDPYQDLYINLKKGYQLLDGDKAEQLVRFRQYPEGDIKRVRVQQDFIQAVIEQKLEIGIISKIPELYNTLTKNIKTNIGVSEVIKYAEVLMDVDTENIVMHALPGNYSEEGEFAASYWLCDMKKTMQLVEDVFGYDASKITIGKAGEAPVYEKPAAGSSKNTEKPTKSPTDEGREDKDDEDKPSKSNKPSASPEVEQTRDPVKTTKPSKSPIPTDDSTEDKVHDDKISETKKPSSTQTSNSIEIDSESGETEPITLPENDGKFVRPGAN